MTKRPDADALAEEFRLVMKGFDVYLEQSPNPGALKNHIAGALKLNAEIHRRDARDRALEEAACIADYYDRYDVVAPKIRLLKERP